MVAPTASVGMLLVFGLIAVAVLLFVREPVPTDVTAVGVLVASFLLKPWTALTVADALSGFSNPATITVVAMYILSAGVQETGIVERLGRSMARLTNGDETRLLAATVAVTSPLAGIVNNTPVVAVFVPMLTDLSRESGVSPSKLLIPLSYAAMLGGTLTLVGTATNVLASDLSRRLIDHPFSMFEFTKLGVVVVVVGGLYLLTAGRLLLPERVDPEQDLTESFAVREHLARVLVRPDSPLVGQPVGRAIEDAANELDVLQILRGDETFVAPATDQEIRARDVLTVRANRGRLRQFIETERLRLLPSAVVRDEELGSPPAGALAEVVVPPESPLLDRPLRDIRLGERYDATVLAVRKRGGDLIHEALDDLELAPGDSLLLQASKSGVDHLVERGDCVVVRAFETPDDLERPTAPLSPRTPVAIGIVAAVIGVAGAGLLPISIAALGGVVAMLATGCLRPSAAYDAVGWNVVFLLAGVIPLGIALQNTGGAAFLATLVAGAAAVLPAVVVLGLFYLLTGVLASLVTPVATVVLLLPIAVDVAVDVGANPFAFVLAVTFAASTAFVTPVGYQTNLMVYGPGGYRFSDYVRIGAPLQVLLAVVTTLGIAFFWGV